MGLLYRSATPSIRAGLACLALGLLCGAAPQPAVPWRSKVSSQVLDQLRRGPAEFILFLDRQADLRAFDGIVGPRRTALVVQTLRETAERTQAALIEELEAAGVEYRSLWIANMIWVRANETVLERLARRSEVRRVDANPKVTLDRPVDPQPAATEPPRRTIEWNLSLVGANQLWAMGYDGSGVVIGGQDTGYDWDHPALKQQYRGWDGQTVDHAYNWHDAIHSGGGSCGADSAEPCDDFGHGTHTLGTMVGDDGASNQIGMAPGARWIGCRNMDQGDGTPLTYSECFQWFVAPTDLDGQNPDPSKAPAVINNSWTCPASEGCSSDALRTVVENTRAAGIVVVVSAGNAGSACGSVATPPAIYDKSFSVGATDALDQIAGFSSRGPVAVDGSGRLKPEISAPGVSVRSSVPAGGYGTSNGTSMAAPHVAGLVALLLDARPDLAGDVETIEALITGSAVPLTTGQNCGLVPGSQVPNNTFGFGRIDAVAMLLGDADGDDVDNLSDCAPVDAAAWARSEPVNDLRLSGSQPTGFAWSSPQAPGATNLEYDLLRSEDAADFTGGVCLYSGVLVATVEDPQIPHSVYFYLVRVRNGCEPQLGQGSDALSRIGPDCP